MLYQIEYYPNISDFNMWFEWNRRGLNPSWERYKTSQYYIKYSIDGEEICRVG